MSIDSLILHNQGAAFVFISIAWIFLSGLIWIPATLLLKKRYDLKTMESKEAKLHREVEVLENKVELLEDEVSVLKTKRKQALISLA